MAQALESKGWDVDLDLCNLASTSPPIEALSESLSQRDRIEAVKKRLKELSDTSDSDSASADPSGPRKKSALILKNSHFGGHKFAGNVVVRASSPCSCLYPRI